jgi:hypothetical protein
MCILLPAGKRFEHVAVWINNFIIMDIRISPVTEI